MRKLFAIITTMCVAFLAVDGASAQEQTTFQRIFSTKTVKIGAVQSFPTFLVDLETNKPTGITPEFMDLVFTRMGVKVEYVKTDWGTAIAGLQAGKYDIMSSLNATPERALASLFSNSMVPSRVAVMTMTKDAGIETKLKSWKLMDDPSLRLAAVDGSATTVLIQKFVTKPAWTLVKGEDAMLLELQSGRVDAVVANQTALLPVRDRIGRGTVIVPDPLIAKPINFAFRKGDEELRD